MTQSSPYIKVTATKRSWVPSQVTRGVIDPSMIGTIHRCLSLRHLELPVRDLLAAGLKRDLPSTPGVVEALEANMEDEERHDQALNFIVDAHGSDPACEAYGLRLRDAMIAHPDHPILKAAILERSVFFVLLPFLRHAGDVGIRTTSGDISLDERRHVAIHSMVAAELGLRPSDSLNALRKQMVSYMFDLLKGTGLNSKDHWIKASNNLYSRGVAPELANTRRTRQIAFFEASNQDLPQYG